MPDHAMPCYAMPCKTFLDLLTTKRNMQRIATQHVVQASFLVCKPSTNRLTKKKGRDVKTRQVKEPFASDLLYPRVRLHSFFS